MLTCLISLIFTAGLVNFPAFWCISFQKINWISTENMKVEIINSECFVGVYCAALRRVDYSSSTLSEFSRSTRSIIEKSTLSLADRKTAIGPPRTLLVWRPPLWLPLWGSTFVICLRNKRIFWNYWDANFCRQDILLLRNNYYDLITDLRLNNWHEIKKSCFKIWQ